MPLPARFSWTLIEAAARWGCMPADIVGWAIAGKLEITCLIGMVTANTTEVSGPVAVPPEDVAPIFRRDGTGPRNAMVRRCRKPGSGDLWLKITDPVGGVPVEAADVMITATELERFEEEHSLTRRVAPGGSASRWDWDGFYTALIRRIHNSGLPDTQRELVAEMQSWFERRSETGEAPDESTIRRKISTLWNELRA